MLFQDFFANGVLPVTPDQHALFIPSLDLNCPNDFPPPTPPK